MYIHTESGGYESRPKATNVFLPTAPRAARGPDISDDRIPNKPPYIAYISNLPYDVDEEDIADFFCNMSVSITNTFDMSLLCNIANAIIWNIPKDAILNVATVPAPHNAIT